MECRIREVPVLIQVQSVPDAAGSNHLADANVGPRGEPGAIRRWWELGHDSEGELGPQKTVLSVTTSSDAISSDIGHQSNIQRILNKDFVQQGLVDR